jgi:hypothetical protein
MVNKPFAFTMTAVIAGLAVAPAFTDDEPFLEAIQAGGDLVTMFATGSAAAVDDAGVLRVQDTVTAVEIIAYLGQEPTVAAARAPGSEFVTDVTSGGAFIVSTRA